jgi:anaerobic magnesium-protoporphyrin IX monomethyl ester cyclase
MARETGPRVPRIWLDLGEFGALLRRDTSAWQDHGLGLLRTVMHRAGVLTDVASTRQVKSWREIRSALAGREMLLMNVRSASFAQAREAARIFHELNPDGVVLTGGLHASVALHEMEAVPEFDRICVGPGENVVVPLATDPAAFPRVFFGEGAKSMDEWPIIDRELFPRPPRRLFRGNRYWPLEEDPGLGWGRSPTATILTSRACPWQCVFCNESSYVPHTGRRSVDSVIDELNMLDQRYGPLGSLVIHDSLFFQNPLWLQEWLEKYPKRARKVWPYWAAARADLVRRWPDLFEALVREAGWHVVSIGFESGSDRVLRILNKECTQEDNLFAIDLLNRIGDDMEREGKTPPMFFSNIMLGIPGERPEDAFDTMAMLRCTHRLTPSPALFAPYPGGALGYQLIAEGKSLLNDGAYTRAPSDEKVAGVDYAFYKRLLRGEYADEIEERAKVMRAWRPGPAGEAAPSLARHALYLFDLAGGGKRLAYGDSPEDALEVLAMRLTPEEMADVEVTSFVRIRQRDLPASVSGLA